MKSRLIMAPGQIGLPLVEGLNRHFRKSFSGQAEKLARLVEEAYSQKVLLDANRVCLLMSLK
jgi:hypothetical protein